MPKIDESFHSIIYLNGQNALILVILVILQFLICCE